VPKNIARWWLTYPSEKYEFVSWDDEIPNMMGKIKAMFQTTNQIGVDCLISTATFHEKSAN